LVRIFPPSEPRAAALKAYIVGTMRAFRFLPGARWTRIYRDRTSENYSKRDRAAATRSKHRPLELRV
ncbi:MAG: hypothetical protein WC314_26455, partial [Vulcanimicrobiota bacterium]